MNIKKYWMVLIIVLISLSTVSCSKDNDNNTSNGANDGNSTEVTTDYTATFSVKTAIVGKELERSKGSYSKGVVFYQDFNNQYWVGEDAGAMYLIHEIRKDGRWNFYDSDIVAIHSTECGIKDMGKITDITNIISKDKINGVGRSYKLKYESEFQPNHGYIVLFTTEEGEQKYLRIFAKDYQLNSGGGLESVTIQYQLY